jgi:two-component system chemotaxis response regulator CheY
MNFHAKLPILVVDDYQGMRAVVSSLLKKQGFTTILEADDGTTAWESILKNRPGLVICDWNMPRMSGLALLQKVRANPDITRLPFMLVTAEGSQEQVLAALDAGVNDYVVKPFTPETFERKVTGVLHETDEAVDRLFEHGHTEKFRTMLADFFARKAFTLTGLDDRQAARLFTRLVENGFCEFGCSRDEDANAVIRKRNQKVLKEYIDLGRREA